jgi:hypothetical protein
MRDERWEMGDGRRERERERESKNHDGSSVLWQKPARDSYVMLWQRQGRQRERERDLKGGGMRGMR